LAEQSIDGAPRLNVLGVGISPTNLAEAVAVIQSWIERCERHYVCVTPVHGVMECQADEDLRRIHNDSGLTVPDGMPLVWAGHLQGFSRMGRVFGPDMMLEVCRISVVEGYTHFLYGGDVGVAEDLKRSLEERFPGINIVGTFTPPFRPLNPEEKRQLINKVARAKPDIFWVGLGCPKQERFMAAYLPKLETKVMLGVGAAFDIHTGRTKDAPIWIKQSGLQWLHRLSQEPRRLWKRYLINNPLFVFKLILQMLSEGGVPGRRRRTTR
jgi:N-acetylglucosaminyldiphosphoundecaprenol N-acetyl-beta-D-mannosaminyltransferase